MKVWKAGLLKLWISSFSLEQAGIQKIWLVCLSAINGEARTGPVYRLLRICVTTTGRRRSGDFQPRQPVACIELQRSSSTLILRFHAMRIRAVSE
jgi:hypothetical protein